MKNLTILGILIIIFFNFSFNLKEKGRNEFFIIFGSGFKYDTVSLVLNNDTVLNKIVLISDTVVGISRITSIRFSKDSLFVMDEKLNVTRKVAFQYSESLRIILKINDRPYDLLAYLKRGKYIIISKHEYYYNVYLNQYKKPISLE